MSKYCAIKDGQAYSGQSIYEVVHQIISYRIVKEDTYSVYINDRKDSISYSLEYTHEEVQKEVSKRLKYLLEGQGWVFYTAMNCF